MPCGDGTGPLGLGPGTGWGYGPCGRRRRLRSFNRIPRISRKFFCRSPFYYDYETPLTKQEEIEMLRKEENILESELKEIRQRLKTLESKE